MVRFVYLPAVGVGALPIDPCAICFFCARWGHHLEEWIGRKPLFRITEKGLRFEDGGRPKEYPWSDISGIVLHRRNTIPFWRTNGSANVATPAFWLSVTVRERGDELRTICVWPRQVIGGLLSLMRFARELQRHLIEGASRGDIPSLLPSKASSARTD